MTVMLMLVGEQPAPNLLPARHYRPETVALCYTERTAKQAIRLKQLMEQDGLAVLAVKVEPYEIGSIVTTIREEIDNRDWRAEDLLFNLTGGTKTMAFAAYDVAQEMRAPILYFQSEGRVSRVYRYSFDGEGHPRSEIVDNVPESITLADYLRLYLEDFESRRPSHDESPGHLFEVAVGDALAEAGFEVMRRVCPLHGSNIEIDLVFRSGNQIGIMECKVKFGRKGVEKDAIDQLVAMAGREYLGTYVARFLVTNRPLEYNNLNLCLTQQVTPIVLPDFAAERRVLDESDRSILLDAVRGRMRLS